jgi:hypothetical protein
MRTTLSLALCLVALLATGCGPTDTDRTAPVAVACDPIEISPTPSLTCDGAIATAAPRLSGTGFRSIARLTFEYGPWCPPDTQCRPFDPEVGHVLVEFADGSRPMAVDVAYEKGHVRAGEAEPVPEWWPGDGRVDGPGLAR